MTKVVNIHTVESKVLSQKNFVYIGRHNQEFYNAPFDNNGYFGNPFKIAGSLTREESLRLFAMYFRTLLERDSDFKKAVLKLRGKVLGCFCKPLDCHGDIIAEYLDA